MKNEKLLKIKELLSSLMIDEEVEAQKFGSITTIEAILYWDGEEDLKEGDIVYVADENGENKVQAEDGEYKLEDGTIYKVENGRVAEVIVPEEPEAEPEVAPEVETEPEVEAEEEEEKPEPEPEVEPEAEPEPEKVEEEVRDLAKEIDELKELVAELAKKLEAVEAEAPATPTEEFEAIVDESKLSKAEQYARALRK